MKDKMQPWFKGFGYEDVFGPSEVPHTKVRKKKIHTHDILSVVNLDGRREIW